MRKILVSMLVFLLLSSVLVACGSPSSNTNSSSSTGPATTTNNSPAIAATTPTQAVQKGGNLVVLFSQVSAVNLGNPNLPPGPRDNEMNAPCVETLLRINSAGDFVPLLAEKYTIAPDGKSVVFNLRKGVKFHDGTPMNAEAVKYCLEKGRESSFSSIKDYTIDAIDENTIRLNMPEGFSWATMGILTGKAPMGYIVSPTALKAHDPDWSRTNPVGTGPFKFVSYVRDASIKYTRNDDYWGGKPNVDTVEARLMADSTTALLTLKNGEAHMFVCQPKDVADLKKSGFTVITSLGATQMYLPSSADPKSPWSNVKVRQAFSYALDRKAMADSLGYGLYKPTFQFWGPDYWAYSTTGIAGQPYDPVKAKQLLTEAGYPNGFSTTLYPTAANDQDTLVQDYAKRIGIDMKIQVVSTAVSSQMGLNGWEGFRMNIANLNEYSDPSTITPNFLSKGVTNISAARFPELIDLDLKLRFETDKAKRKILLDAINKGVVDTYTAFILFYSQTNVMAVSPKLHDTGRYIFTTDYSKVWFSK